RVLEHQTGSLGHELARHLAAPVVESGAREARWTVPQRGSKPFPRTAGVASVRRQRSWVAVRKAREARMHRVRRGDKLYVIEHKHGPSPDRLFVRWPPC